MITKIILLNKFSVHLNEKLNIHKKAIEIVNRLKDVNKKLKWTIDNPKDIGVDDNLLLYYPKNSKKYRLLSHPLKRLQDFGMIDKYLEQTTNYLNTDINTEDGDNTDIVEINIEEKKIEEVEIKEKLEKLKEKVNSIKFNMPSRSKR